MDTNMETKKNIYIYMKTKAKTVALLKKENLFWSFLHPRPSGSASTGRENEAAVG